MKGAPALFTIPSPTLTKFREQGIIVLVGINGHCMFCRKSFNPSRSLKKERIAYEKTTHCSRETLRSATAGTQPEAHLAPPRVLQVG
jgi:hypothetical protein